MWSGPRNISTALMRAWGSRTDTTVWDEPLYAHYLAETGREHPGRDRVIAHHETNLERLTDRMTGPVPDGKAIYYQKHMAHHLLPEMSWDWVHQLRNAFLIRDPREMLPSLAEFLQTPTLRDTGLKQQWVLFQNIRQATGTTPPVIDARDVLKNPPVLLCALCEALDVPFRDSMLSWEPGLRDTDGIWADEWYDAVRQSTGFQPYTPKEASVPDSLTDLLDTCQTYYRRLHAHRLHP